MTDKTFRGCLEATTKGLMGSIKNKEYLIDTCTEHQKTGDKKAILGIDKTINLYVSQIAVFEIQLQAVRKELDRINKGEE